MVEHRVDHLLNKLLLWWSRRGNTCLMCMCFGGGCCIHTHVHTHWRSFRTSVRACPRTISAELSVALKIHLQTITITTRWCNKCPNETKKLKWTWIYPNMYSEARWWSWEKKYIYYFNSQAKRTQLYHFSSSALLFYEWPLLWSLSHRNEKVFFFVYFNCRCFSDLHHSKIKMMQHMSSVTSMLVATYSSLQNISFFFLLKLQFPLSVDRFLSLMTSTPETTNFI